MERERFPTPIQSPERMNEQEFYYEQEPQQPDRRIAFQKPVFKDEFSRKTILLIVVAFIIGFMIGKMLNPIVIYTAK
jgi:hypothetical protein